MAVKKQKMSPISLNQKIDYKDIDLLKFFQDVPQGLQYNNSVN